MLPGFPDPAQTPSPFVQPGPKPGDEQSEFAKATANYTAQGAATHRVPEASPEVKDGEWGDVVEQLHELARGASGIVAVEDTIKANADVLPKELMRDPVAASAAVVITLSILAAPIAAERAAGRPTDSNAQLPTPASLTSALGQRLETLDLVGTDSAVKVANLLLGAICKNWTVKPFFDFEQTRSETKGSIGVELPFPH